MPRSIASYAKEMMQTIDYAWRVLTNDSPPIAHDLRKSCVSRWVRFHSLPDSKRYAESELEYCEILARHNTIMGTFAAEGSLLHLLTAGYSENLSPERSYPELLAINPNAEPWRSVQIEENWYFHVFHSVIRWSKGIADPILRLVADDVVREVVFVEEAGLWAYHPYDGGGDVICPDVEARNELALDYSNWLSRHPLGL